MKKKITFLLLATVILFSCNQNEKKAIKEYQNCMLALLSDSLLSLELINEKHQICLDSVLAKYELSEDHSFIAEFDSIPDVVNTKQRLHSTLKANIDKILQNNDWKYENIGWNWRENRADLFDFDGKMFKHEVYAMTGRALEWDTAESWTGTYDINVEKERIYIAFTYGDGEVILYRFRQNNAGRFYLDGPRRVWQVVE